MGGIWSDENVQVTSTLKLATWNVAAINNNPFEYWVTYNENPAYKKLMVDVENFIVNPGKNDVQVKEVFTEATFQKLKALMEKQNWNHVDVVERMWKEDYQNRRIISEFMKDKTIGSKRLASMLDRVTNTLNLANGGQVFRPTAINMFEGGAMDTIEQWFDLWSTFLFETPVAVDAKDPEKTQLICNMLLPIKKKKYPAVTEEEEAASIPLQTLVGGIFDAILIHMLNTLAPGKWMDIKMELGSKLNKGKLQRTYQIIEKQYMDRDIIFLQEVSAAFAAQYPTSLSSTYDLHVPEQLDSKRDQNSMILTSKRLGFSVTKEVSQQILDSAPESVGCGKGDFFAIEGAIGSEKYILASFHGDTNGLQTIPITKAADFAMKNSFIGHRMIFGLDANVYEKENPNMKKVQLYTGYTEALAELGVLSCFGDDFDPARYTTYNARTYLQAQLNKACKSEEIVGCGDINPKDFILFYGDYFEPVSFSKDNTGRGEYIEEMLFPTLEFPSDHAVLSAEIRKFGQTSV